MVSQRPFLAAVAGIVVWVLVAGAFRIDEALLYQVPSSSGYGVESDYRSWTAWVVGFPAGVAVLVAVRLGSGAKARSAILVTSVVVALLWVGLRNRDDFFPVDESLSYADASERLKADLASSLAASGSGLEIATWQVSTEWVDDSWDDSCRSEFGLTRGASLWASGRLTGSVDVGQLSAELRGLGFVPELHRSERDHHLAALEYTYSIVEGSPMRVALQTPCLADSSVAVTN